MPDPVPTPSPARGGFTLVELLIVMVVLVAIMGATFELLQSQGRSFRGNTERYDLVQNVRNALEGSERVIRTMGAGVTSGQPMLVYGANTVLAFNSDHVERDTTDMRWAAYWNPDTPIEETVVWQVAAATPIPNSSPNYTYPDTTYRLGNGTLSPAETYMLYLEADAATPRADDFALMQRVNAGTPEILARGILPHPSGRPFFEYLLHRSLSTGDTLFVATGSLVPLIRRPLISGISSADSSSRVRPDSVRAVRLNLRVTNGQTGVGERFRDVSTTIEVPNNGIAMPTVCGRPPLPPAALVATEVGTGAGTVDLSWTRSPDQDAGEIDVRQYVVWRRLASEAIWDAPLLFVRAERDTTSYVTTVTDHTPGESYLFGIAAQDCTPNFSTIPTAAITLTVP
jgi:prepilin-type N-terminal cleavage/methylation domain-containing protein